MFEELKWKLIRFLIDRNVLAVARCRVEPRGNNRRGSFRR